MALTLTVDHPDFPEGTVFGIQGLGLFNNGESREVTEAEEISFASYYQMDPKEKLSQSALLTVEGDSTIENLDDILGKEISSLPGKDPTAMNIDPTTGEVFEFANLGGAVTDPEIIPTEEEEATAVAPAPVATGPDNVPSGTDADATHVPEGGES